MIEFPSPPGPQENWPDGWEWTGFGWGRVLDRSSQGTEVIIAETPPLPVVDKALYFDNSPTAKRARLFLGYQKAWVATDPIRDRGSGGGNGTSLADVEYWLTNPDNGWIWDNVVTSVNDERGAVTITPEGLTPEQTEVIEWLSDNSTVDSSGIHFTLPLWSDGGFHTMNPQLLTYTEQSMASVWWVEQQGYYSEANPPPGVNGGPVVTISESRPDPASVPFWWDPNKSSTQSRLFISYDGDWVAVDPITDRGGGDGDGTSLTEVQDWVEGQGYVTQTVLPFQIRTWVIDPVNGVYTESNPPPPSATQPPIFSSFWFPGTVTTSSTINITIVESCSFDNTLINGFAVNAPSGQSVFSINKLSGGTTTTIGHVNFTGSVGTPDGVATNFYRGDVLQVTCNTPAAIANVSITIGLKRVILPEPDTIPVFYTWQNIQNLPSQPGITVMSTRDWVYPAGTYDITFTAYVSGFNQATLGPGVNEGGRAEMTYSVWLSKFNSTSGDTGFSPEVMGSATIISDGSPHGGPELVNYSFGPFRVTLAEQTTIYARGQFARTANNQPGNIQLMCVVGGESKRIGP